MTQQRDLFDTDPAPWELDDQAHQRIATVVFSEGVEGSFDYVVPNHLSDVVSAGKRVKVPLGRGNRRVVAYCISVDSGRSSRRLKEVIDVLDGQVLFSQDMLRLTSWIADYYVAPLGKVLETVVPAGVRGRSGTREKIFLHLAHETSSRVADLKLSPKQTAVVEILANSADPMSVDELADAAGCTSGPINTLRKRGLIQETKQRVQVYRPAEVLRESEERLQLNRHQTSALATISHALEEQRHETILLHGVTGSGKTEVYIRAIEQVIRYGRQAIVLVPEISLTPQTQRRFLSRFRDVAVLHSHLSDADRHWHWQQIASGKIQVVVGARSAVFAPTPNLGLIIIDEEHDGSFKQDNVPRYHARDVAVKRAEFESIPLVLGSATPCLESWHRAKEENYRLVSMPNRVSELPLPEVALVDMREEFHNKYLRGAIGRHLHDEMKIALRNGGQVILLLNRRGFSTHIQCPCCGNVVKCKDCDIALTHHRTGEKAVCHYCDFETSAPLKCPDCDFENIRYGGLGTQKLEAEVRSQFPNHACLRMDSDTMRKPGSHELALSKFRNGEIRVLLGTQMIAKGLDFPNVTLVGVINADTGLNLPDFRASERAFQLITQVAGRTGRSKRGGKVLVQTFNPDHDAIRAARCHDFHAFADTELPSRELFGYPPFGSMARCVIRGEHEDATKQFSETLACFIRDSVKSASNETEIRILGPAAAPIAKLRGRFRFHMIIQTKDLDLIRPAIRSAHSEIKLPEGIQWIVDIDPMDML